MRDARTSPFLGLVPEMTSFFGVGASKIGMPLRIVMGLLGLFSIF